MKKEVFIVLLAIGISCRGTHPYSPEDLRKLTQQELLERVKNYQPTDLNKVVFKDDRGNPIPQGAIDQFEAEDYVGDNYVNEEGEIVEIVVRKASESDKQFHQKMEELALLNASKGNEIEHVEIDCTNQQHILQQVFDTDQGSRGPGNEIDGALDRRNLSVVISLIEKCGMPTLEEVSRDQMSSVWLVFQHANNEYRKKYLPVFRKSAQRGDIDQTVIAMMEDRILVIDGKPQIYGTQLKKNEQTGTWELYEIADPATVDKRRAAIGFGSLQEYLDRWNIAFDVPQKE